MSNNFNNKDKIIDMEIEKKDHQSVTSLLQSTITSCYSSLGGKVESPSHSEQDSGFLKQNDDKSSYLFSPYISGSGILFKEEILSRKEVIGKYITVLTKHLLTDSFFLLLSLNQLRKANSLRGFKK